MTYEERDERRRRMLARIEELRSEPGKRRSLLDVFYQVGEEFGVAPETVKGIRDRALKSAKAVGV